MKLTKNDWWIKRFWAYLEERFPVAQGILFLILYLTAILYGRFLSSPGELVISLEDIPGFIAFYLFFFLLRVFDEHKDYKEDCINYPNRVLQRGLITLNQLRILGLFSILIQAGISLTLDRGVGMVTISWLMALGWSLLMAKEFFCPDWLKPRLVLYAFSHMLIMPLLLIWAMTMGNNELVEPLGVLLLGLMSFFCGFTFEITRKLRAPEDEIDGVDSYTKVFGAHRAPLVVLGVMLAGTIFLLLLLAPFFGSKFGAVWFVLPCLLFFIACPPFWQFAHQPSREGVKKMTGGATIFMLFAYIILNCALIISRGVALN